jgi:uncharacterized protein
VLTLLIKPASSACNLRCSYCFYRRQARPFMTLETLETLVKNALLCAQDNCTFTFQGGEPTLVSLPFYRRLLELQQEYNLNCIEIQNSLQTNGFLIDDAWAAFLAENKFLVGLSLDGPRALHNRHRDGSYEQVMRAVHQLKKHGAECNILTVVTAYNVRRADELWQFYQKHAFRWLQFIPCLDFDLRPLDYGRFLVRLFELWYADWRCGGATDVRFFSNLVQMAAGYPPEACGMCGQCVPYSAIEADGSVYPCDFYVDEAWRLGMVEDAFTALLQGETARRFALLSQPVAEVCRVCAHYALCRGGCRRWRNSAGLNVLCEGYQYFFSRCGGAIRSLARMLDAANAGRNSI